MITSLCFYITLITACSAAPLLERQWNGMRVPLPSSDPWYFDNNPCDLTSLKPGDVIDKRAVEIPTFLNQSVSSAWQVKFRTTDSRFRPTWAITTLYSPKNRDNLALISYQHFTDSADIDKSPSYAILHQKPSDDLTWQLFVGGLAGKWYVNMPDYQGPGASFGAGLMTGHATLDSIRAVKRVGSRYTGLTDDIPVALWGYSGGALATEWAAELQGTYAPELKITGAVLGGLTPNTTHIFETTSSPNSNHADLIPNAVRGLAVQYPEVKPDLVSATNTSSYEDAVKILTKETSDPTKQFINLRSIMNSLLASCRVRNVLSIEGLMGYNGNVPQMPLFIHHAEHDSLAPVEDVRKLKERYCGLSRSVTISLRINTATTGIFGTDMHASEGASAALSAPGSWLPDVLGGKLPKGCTESLV